MVTAYIGLGANLGDCRENLLQAWKKLGKVTGINLLAISSPYRSEPVGMESENWFVNAVGSLETSLEPHELLREMFVVEKYFDDIKNEYSEFRDILTKTSVLKAEKISTLIIDGITL